MSDRVLRNTPANLQVTFGADETPTDPTGNAATVTITRADGTALVTAAAATRQTTGVYRYTLAPQANLDFLTVAWTGTFSGQAATITTYAEIVGGFYVTLAELRALPNLSDVVKFTTLELASARRWFEETFEAYTGVAWVPRYARERVSGNGQTALLLPHQRVRTVRSVRSYSDATTYTAFTAAELADLRPRTWGSIERGTLGSFTAGSQNLVVEYEHGFDQPPSDVVDSAKVAIREHLLDAQSGNRVERSFGITTGEGGVIRNVLPGPGRPFGIPAVDAIANARSHKAPAVA